MKMTAKEKARLTEEVKARISPKAKRTLDAIADSREVKPSQIIREALRDYLTRNRHRTRKAA